MNATELELQYPIAEIEITYRSKVKAINRKTIRDSRTAFNVFLSVWDMDKIELVEQGKIILLDIKSRMMGISHFTTGGHTSVIFDPRIIFGMALKARASTLILTNNHPSGETEPSGSEIKNAKELAAGAKILGIHISDYLTITKDGYFSFADNGLV